MMEVHIGAEVEGETPAGAVAQMEAGNLDSVTLGEEEELGTHNLTGTTQTLAVVGVTLHATFHERVDGERQLLTLSVDDSLAGEGYVAGTLGEHEGILGVVLAHHVAVAHHLQLVIVIGIGAAQEHSTALEVELYPTLQLDGPGEVKALADCQLASTLLRQTVDGVLDSFGVKGLAIGNELERRRGNHFGGAEAERQHRHEDE